MCGIAGIVTKSPRPFDYPTFCTLGIANDSRGGDSCGVFIDGQYDYGVKENKLFQNYFLDSDWLFLLKHSTVAFVHCRKASVGIIDKTTAQPVIIEENNKVQYVLMHNGTIYNYKELANKYIKDIDISNMTDSQVMAHIFYHSGYNCLSEYIGSAVFAIADYRNKYPKIFLFKGASKKNNFSKIIEEERPLYYCIDKYGKELVFSSIGTYLLALRRDCQDLPTNMLLEFNGNALINRGIYDRSNCTQTKEFQVPRCYKFSYDDDTFISIDHTHNLYSSRGRNLHGRVYLSENGNICYFDAYQNFHEIWFYDGVALKSREDFMFLIDLQSKSKFSREDFHKKFENVIRFLSIDGIYYKDNLWVKAISTKDSIVYTGKLQPLTSVLTCNIVDGIKKSSIYNKESNYIQKLKINGSL